MPMRTQCVCGFEIEDKTMGLELGQLKNLTLKSVWSHEERDFTPWLAEESHLAELSEAFGKGSR